MLLLTLGVCDGAFSQVTWHYQVVQVVVAKWGRENTCRYMNDAKWQRLAREQRDRVAKCRRSVTLHLYGGGLRFGGLALCDIVLCVVCSVCIDVTLCSVTLLVCVLA